MAFPVTVKFKRPLKAAIDTENLQSTLNYIQKEIGKKKAHKVSCINNEINYKGSTSYYRGSLFGGMSGVFTILHDGNQSLLVYEIRMYNLFITASIMSVIFGVMSQMVWLGVGAFAWLGGMNWFTSLVRHGSFATELAAGIDAFHGIPAIKRDDNGESIRDERLKSWM